MKELQEMKELNEILKLQVSALKELLVIKDQTIQSLKPVNHAVSQWTYQTSPSLQGVTNGSLHVTNGSLQAQQGNVIYGQNCASAVLSRS